MAPEINVRDSISSAKQRLAADGNPIESVHTVGVGRVPADLKILD